MDGEEDEFEFDMSNLMGISSESLWDNKSCEGNKKHDRKVQNGWDANPKAWPKSIRSARCSVLIKVSYFFKSSIFNNKSSRADTLTSTPMSLLL